jgi:uncharacterized membrane protein
MAGEHLNIITATFDDEVHAAKGLATLASALDHGDLGPAAVVLRTPDGKVRFVETHDSTTGQGAVKGFGFGAIAGLVGLLFGPVALLAAPVGAGVGALLGKLRDTGCEDDNLQELGADLAPGPGAVLATVAADTVDKAKRLLDEVGATRVVVSEMSTDLASILDATTA